MERVEPTLQARAHAKDAEAAGRYALAFIKPTRRCDRGVSLDVIATLARWAFHWARLSLDASL